jgi:hypothetical protein|tara:strand:- start:644 stop:799 length:156 start_codon:yes stop_codon:yes gene_type:complete
MTKEKKKLYRVVGPYDFEDGSRVFRRDRAHWLTEEEARPYVEAGKLAELDS